MLCEPAMLVVVPLVKSVFTLAAVFHGEPAADSTKQVFPERARAEGKMGGRGEISVSC